MFDINTKVQWRTGGRGVFRAVKGTVLAVVKAGTLPKTKAMQSAMPHGTKPSNRDRYIVEIKDGVFAWANIKTTYKQGEKMPKHVPRLGVPSKPKGKAKAKPAVKAKAKPAVKGKAKPAVKPKTKPAVKAKKPNKPAPPTSVENPAKKPGDKPKTTWYGVVDDKVVSVRKVLCPEGFSKDKPMLEVPSEPEVIPQAAAEQPSLPQAV